ncbi:MAG: hypothetical protein RR131_08470 [Anaerovorax sp.]
MRKKKKLFVLLLAVVMVFSMVACSSNKDPVNETPTENPGDAVKKEGQILKADLDNFFDTSKDALGEKQAQLKDEFQATGIYGVTAVEDGQPLSTALNEKVLVKTAELKEKADAYASKHPEMKQTRDEYVALLDEMNANANDVMNAIKNKDQAAFDTAKTKFDRSKDQFVGFEEKSRNALEK